MPAVIPVIVAAVSAASTYAAAKTAANASENAASLQTNAVNHATDVQSQSNAAALAFQQQQAALDRQTAEATRRANYDQWAAQQRRLGSVGELLGLGGRDIPDYVPLPSTQTTATSSSMPAGAPSGTSAAGSGIDLSALSDPKAWMNTVGDTTKLTEFVTRSLGSAANVPGLVNYYVGKIQQQPGANEEEQKGSASYWMQKMQSDPNVTGRSSTAGVSSVGSLLGANAAPDYTTGFMQAPSPTLQLPSPYRGSY